MKKNKILLILLLSTLAQGQFWENPNQKPSLFGMQINRLHPLSYGLVGCWLFNEGSGNIVNDLSGHGGTTDEVNAFTWGASKYGPGLVQSGDNNQEVELPDAYKPLDGKTAFTVKVLCNPIAITLDYGIFYTDTHDLSEPIALWFDDAGTDHIAAIVTGSGGTTGVLYSNYAPVGGVGNWYDIVLTWDGTTLRLFVNGVEDLGGDFPDTNATGVLTATGFQYHIGNAQPLNKDFSGIIDHCMLWDRVLSTPEIALLYREPFCMFEPSWDWNLYFGISVAAAAGQVIVVNMD